MPLFKKRFELGLLVALPGRERERHRFSGALGSVVNFRGESALGPAERFCFLVPPFAPAACW